MRYVIIGNSAAAVGCIEGIRQLDQEGSITVLSKESYPVYSRPLISYLLCGKTDLQRMKYRPDDFYEKNNAKLMLGAAASSIDSVRKEVVLEDGRKIAYDKLLIATGSDPVVPPIAGLETVKQKFTFLSLDDACSLDEAVTKDSRVLILGAGLIGLKCAEGIYGKAGSITVVDLADRILPSILDETASAIVQAHIKSKGIGFYLSDSIVRLQENKAHLKSGKSLEFDILVLAVGVRPNDTIAALSGICCDRGIKTDAFCRTSLPDVYAAGDCAKSHDIITGTDRVLALLPNAYMQGNSAGIHMAGGGKPYDKAIAMNAIGFFGLHMITAGNYDGEARIKQEGNVYKKLVTKNGRLVGYILLEDIARAGIYTALIREKTPLSSLDSELIFEKPQLMAFAQQKRKELLGGVPV